MKLNSPRNSEKLPEMNAPHVLHNESYLNDGLGCFYL